MKDNQTEEKKERKFRIAHFIDGSILDMDFLRNQYKLLIMIAVLLVIYIANHYAVNMKIDEVDRLRKELQEATYGAMIENSYLMQESRQSHIKALVDEKGLDLDLPDQPAYRLSVKPEKNGR